MGEGHFIKSVAIRWELVHTDNYLRSNPALVTLCTLLGVVYTASEVLLGMLRRDSPFVTSFGESRQGREVMLWARGTSSSR